jgi:hypothetical protein
MIKGMENKSRIIRALESSEQYCFHLAGSRYFETNAEYSDWDFCVGVGDSPDLVSDEEADLKLQPLVSFLKSAGFCNLKNYNYGITDKNTLFVFRAYDRCANIMVDVAIVNSIDIKLECQNAIKRLGLTDKLDKTKHTQESIAEFWNTMAEIVKGRSSPIE